MLLVEDEEPVRAVVREILEMHDYEVLEAADGEEALALSQHYDGAIDVLLTDVEMPRMGGRELANELASERPETHILYMSGYAAAALSEGGSIEPAGGFIQKPFTIKALTRKLSELLEDAD